MATETSSCAAANADVVERAAVPLAELIAEPIALRSAETVPRTSGVTNTKVGIFGPQSSRPNDAG
ncbi:hypothetical protein MYIN104542_30245 [Mycobacterium intermedium]